MIIDGFYGDHPRTCGENKTRIFCPSIVPGSPPHLRGKLRLIRYHEQNRRITPAPAGKTKITGHFYLRKLDHPRTCGENSSTSLLRYIIGGSPPHLRGKPGQIFYDHLHQRITPAPAGKTGCVLPVGCTVEDHPRTCGENIGKRKNNFYAKGSPPHLRGKLLKIMPF